MLAGRYQSKQPGMWNPTGKQSLENQQQAQGPSPACQSQLHSSPCTDRSVRCYFDHSATKNVPWMLSH